MSGGRIDNTNVAGVCDKPSEKSDIPVIRVDLGGSVGVSSGVLIVILYLIDGGEVIMTAANEDLGRTRHYGSGLDSRDGQGFKGTPAMIAEYIRMLGVCGSQVIKRGREESERQHARFGEGRTEENSAFRHFEERNILGRGVEISGKGLGER